jgi:glutamine cyclotransferase
MHSFKITLISAMLLYGGTLLYAGSTPVWTYMIIAAFPHDQEAFTQGLLYHEGYLYESTGQRGRSSVRKLDIETGAILQKYELEDQYFGEGLTYFRDRLIQLTWQSFTGFVYDPVSLYPMEQFYYSTEGWGLTDDGTQLIMSDGTADLYFLEPSTYAVVRTLTVTDDGKPVRFLNELEYINGEIFANILSQNRIACIDPHTGVILRWIDLTGISAALPQGYAIDVLNGIAYDPGHDRLFVTGKLWPRIFEIRLISSAEH